MQTAQRFNDPSDLLKAIRRRATTLPEFSMKVGRISQMVLTHPPEYGAEVIDKLIVQSIGGDPPAREAVLSLCMTLLNAEAGRMDTDRYDAVRGIYQSAAERGLDRVTYFILQLPPHRVLANRKALQGPRFDREVSLGERKTMAASPRRQLFEALLVDLDPSVVRKLCVNPHLNEQDMLRICTRRPNIPEALMEVAVSPRWLVRYNIRYALLCNPFAPTGLGLKVLPTLRQQDLRDVARAGDLHPAIAHAARRLLDLRSPTSDG